MGKSIDGIKKSGSVGSAGEYRTVSNEELTGDERVVGLDQILGEIGYGWCQYKLYLICGIAFAADAMEVSLLSFLSQCAGEDWDLSDAQKSSITSVVFAGELVSATLWGPLADKYGRKICFIIACCMIFGAGLLSAFSPSYEWLIVFRLIVGFGVGGLCVPFDMLAEFLPPTKRGSYLMAIEFFWTIGSCFVAGMAWLFLDSMGWRFLAIITSLPVGLSLASAYFLVESPRWLIGKGRMKEAQAIMDQAAIDNNVMLKPYILHDLSAPVEEEGNIFDLFSAELRTTTISLWVIWTAFGFTYYGLILFIARVFSDDSSDGCSFKYMDIFISACSEFAGVFIWINLVDRIGRRHSQGVGYAISGVMACLLGMGFSYSSKTATATIGRMAVMGASSTTWVATPEVYPTRIRATGHSLANAIARLGAFASPYLTGAHTVSNLAIGFILLVGNMGAATAAYFLPETAGKGMDETDERDSVHRLSEVLLPSSVVRSNKSMKQPDQSC